MGLRIRKYRKDLKLTQEALGKKLGVTKGAVSQWEKGDIKNMTHARLFKMADLFKRRPRFLALGEGDEFPLTLKKDEKEVIQLAKWIAALPPESRELLHDLLSRAISDEQLSDAWNAKGKKP